MKRERRNWRKDGHRNRKTQTEKETQLRAERWGQKEMDRSDKTGTERDRQEQRDGETERRYSSIRAQKLAQRRTQKQTDTGGERETNVIGETGTERDGQKR